MRQRQDAHYCVRAFTVAVAGRSQVKGRFVALILDEPLAAAPESDVSATSRGLAREVGRP